MKQYIFMLQPIRHIQYTAIMNILVITTIMAIIIFISISSVLYNKAINADVKVLQQFQQLQEVQTLQ